MVFLGIWVIVDIMFCSFGIDWVFIILIVWIIIGRFLVFIYIVVDVVLVGIVDIVFVIWIVI